MSSLKLFYVIYYEYNINVSSLKLLESRGGLNNNQSDIAVKECRGGRGEAKACDTAARVVMNNGTPSLLYYCHVFVDNLYFFFKGTLSKI